MRPLSPCHLKAEKRGDGGVRLSWVGGSRSAWGWLDSVEAVPDADFAGFRVRLNGPLGAIDQTTSASALSFEAVEIAAIGTLVSASVCQAGWMGLSHSADVDFTI